MKDVVTLEAAKYDDWLGRVEMDDTDPGVRSIEELLGIDERQHFLVGFTFHSGEVTSLDSTPPCWVTPYVVEQALRQDEAITWPETFATIATEGAIPVIELPDVDVEPADLVRAFKRFGLFGLRGSLAERGLELHVERRVSSD